MDVASIAALLGAALSAGSAAPEGGAEDRTAPSAQPTAALAGDDSLSKREDRRWIERWAPEPGMLELGVYGGLLFPASDHELFELRQNRPDQGFQKLNKLAPTVGGRIGYLPSRYFGIEFEGGASPTQTRDTDLPVTLWTARGHFVGQLGWWSVTPFVVLGGGVVAASSGEFALGNDIDPELHFGVGAKAFITRRLSARIDLRDVVTSAQGAAAGATNNLEALLGLSLTLGRQRDRDKRPEPEPRPEPAPEVIPDTDGDGFLDPDDKCPTDPGVQPDGCPLLDSDDDGFLDPDDACPREAGIAPDGCPVQDRDNDGIVDDADQCPDEMETFNGFEDADGCPDELPDALRDVNATLRNVFFQVDKALLEPQSKTALDEVVETLTTYDTVRVEVSGHTDSTGAAEHNVELSQQRAEAVQAYLVDHGIAADRIQTRGAGSDEPIDTNNSKDGRARNRRIEFRILD